MNGTEFRLDLNEKFDNLPKAPIVEAVIHWRARPTVQMASSTLLNDLRPYLTEYAEPQEQHEFHVGAEFKSDGATTQQRHGWHGLKAASKDNRFIAQFTRNGFVLSHLKPYGDWGAFQAEALRLWAAFVKIAQPSEIDRLGVRFINVMEMRDGESVGELLSFPPQTPKSMNLPISEFMHQTQFDIPSHGYRLNVIQTIQRNDDKTSVILDLDVFTRSRPAATDDNLTDRLQEMQWIKNKAFFTFIKESTIARFK